MPAYVTRDIEPVLHEMIAQFPAVAVTGPRQSGKTTMLQRVLPSYAYVSLDDPLVRAQALDDPELLLDMSGDRLVIDEIQYAPSLLSHLKMRIDRQRDRYGAFVLTGSQQFGLMKGLGETLAGRVALLELLPFTVHEIASAAEGAGDAVDTRTVFLRACLRGSFPEVVLRPELAAERWHAAYVQTYLERDIRSLYDVGSLRDFERFLRLLAARCAQALNVAGLASDVGVAANTIRRWLSILEAARIVYLLPPYHNNLGKRITKAPKVHFLDCGLACYLTGVRDPAHVLGGPLAGPLFESFCIQEAVKITLAAGGQPRLHYLRTHAGLEVDLLVEDAAGRVIPFEFKLAATPRPGMAAPLRRFAGTFAALQPAPGAVVSLSPRRAALAEGVQLAPLDAFLDTVRLAARP
jgi:uncharacterized protein